MTENMTAYRIVDINILVDIGVGNSTQEAGVRPDSQNTNMFYFAEMHCSNGGFKIRRYTEYGFPTI